MSFAFRQQRQAYRVDEVADLLACSRRTVYNMVERGEVDALRLSNSKQRAHIRVTRDSLDRFLHDPKRRVI